MTGSILNNVNQHQKENLDWSSNCTSTKLDFDPLVLVILMYYIISEDSSNGQVWMHHVNSQNCTFNNFLPASNFEESTILNVGLKFQNTMKKF